MNPQHLLSLCIYALKYLECRHYVSKPMVWCLLAVLFYAVAGFAQSPDSGVVALWHLEEGSGQTAVDSSGYGNDAVLGKTANAEASDPVWTGGRAGGALEFDGIASRLTVPSSPSFNSLPAFSYVAWIYPTGWGGNGFGRIVSKESSANVDEVHFLVNGPSRTSIIG
jgi:hypothetical protein